MAVAGKPEIAKRVIAARSLLGWEQADLKAAFAEEGLAAYDAQNLEGYSGEKAWQDMPRHQRLVVAETLEVSIGWLTGPLGPIQAANRKSTVAPDFAERLEARRSELGLSMLEVAQKMQTQGWDIEVDNILRVYQKWIAGDTQSPHMRNIYAVAKVLKLDPENLLAQTSVGPSQSQIEADLAELKMDFKSLLARLDVEDVARDTAKTGRPRQRKPGAGEAR